MHHVSRRPVPEGWLLDSQGQPTRGPGSPLPDSAGLDPPARRAAILQGVRDGPDPGSPLRRPFRRPMLPPRRTASPGPRETTCFSSPSIPPGLPAPRPSSTRRPSSRPISARLPAPNMWSPSSCLATPNVPRARHAPCTVSPSNRISGKSSWTSPGSSASRPRARRQLIGPILRSIKHSANHAITIDTSPCRRDGTTSS